MKVDTDESLTIELRGLIKALNDAHDERDAFRKSGRLEGISRYNIRVEDAMFGVATWIWRNTTDDYADIFVRIRGGEVAGG